MPHPLLADSWVAAQIDAAIAPYRGVWPPEAIEVFRKEIAITLASHPTAARLLREARPRDKEISSEATPTGDDPYSNPKE